MRGAAALLLVFGLLACDRAPEPAGAPRPAYPAGTVLAVDGVPIRADEVERWVPVTRLLEPDKVLSHWRRLALANIVLPLRAGEALDPRGREAAYAHATHLRGLATERGALPEEVEHRDVTEGTWKDLGLIDWELARELEVGAWSEVYETVGGWAFFRLLERPAEFGPLSVVRIERAHACYLDPEAVRGLIDEALRTLPIEVVDPEWEALVPPIYLQNSPPRTP